MGDNDVLIQIRGDVADINAKLADLKGHIGKVKDETEGLSRSSKSSWEIISAGWASLTYMAGRVVEKIKQIGGALLDLAGMSGEAEAADRKLVSTMQAHNIASEGMIKAYRAMAEVVMIKTGVDDEQIKTAQRMLTILNVQPGLMREAVDATMAVASTGRSLEDSTKAVGLAMAGEYRQLGLLIPELRGLERKGADVHTVLRAVAESIGKTEEAMDDTYVKKVQRLGTAWGELKETLGNHVLPVMKSLVDWSISAIHQLEGLGSQTSLAWKIKEIDILEGKLRKLKASPQTVFDVTTGAEKPAPNYLSSIAANEARLKELRAQVEEAHRDNQAALAEGDKAFKAVKIPNPADAKREADEYVDMVVEVFKKIRSAQEKEEEENDRFFADLKKTREKQRDDEYQKGMEIFENTEKANKEYLAKMPAQMKAERESDINQQLAALDLAEKLGTAHRDTLDERIRLTLELLRVQEAYLASLDPEKDAGAIISQREALSKTRQALADISRDLELRNPISAIDLGLKEVSNTAADTGRQMRDATTKAFDGMSDALTEYAVTGKATFKDLADAIVRDLMRIQIRAAMAGITGGSGLGGMLSNLFGSSPSPGTFDSGVGDWAATFSASHHAGGAVGSRGPYRLVINPDLLPRKHSGGMAPNERMVINKVGERYVTEEQNDWLTSIAKSASRGGSAPDENHIHVHMSVNALDSQSVSQSLAKHQSEIVGMVQYAYNRIGQRGPLGR